MKIKILLYFLLLFTTAQVIIAQSGRDTTKNKFGISIALNSTDAQFGSPEHSTWAFRSIGNSKIYNQYKDAEGNIADKSFSLSLITKCFFKTERLIRIELNFTDLNLNTHTAITQIKTDVYDESWRQQIYKISPGIQWNLYSKKKIEIFSGVSASVIKYNKMKYQYIYESRSVPTDSVEWGEREENTWPGGFAAGIGSFAGLNIHLKKWITIGTELSTSLLYYKIGEGEATSVLSDYSGTTIYSTQNASYPYYRSYKGVKFSKVLTSFNISIWL